MTENLRFPASGAKRWLTCLGSVREEMKHPRKPSKYADEGLLAHHLGEMVLNLTPPTPRLSDMVKVGDIINLDDGTAHTVTEDHVTYTQEYVDYVAMVKGDDDVWDVYVEVELDLAPWTRPGQRGIADCVLVNRDTLDIHVIDLKFGRGVEEYAYQNPQLSLYGLAIVRQLEPLYGTFNDVSLHIAQPRRNHFDRWGVSCDLLIAWGGDTKATVDRIIATDELPYAPSEDACRFCRASGNCRAQAEVALGTVTEGFEALVTPFEKMSDNPLIEERDVTVLLPDEVFNCLHNVELIKTWCKAIEAQGQLLLERGQAPDGCGYKLVEGKTNRVWTDEKKSDRALARAGLAAADRYAPRKLISVAVAEKKIGKTHKVMKNYVDKPKGATTIARDTDKRPAINIDPTEGFDNVG